MNQHNIHLPFKAFADPNRLRILHILTHGERCVCDIMAVLKMGQSRVSRHLAYLRRAGLVSARREGLWIHYSLARSQKKLEKKLIDCLGSCLNETALFNRDIRLLNAITKNKHRAAMKQECQ